MATSSGNGKICVICGEDCSTRPRTKDTKGRYYCKGCYEKATQRKQSLTGRVVSADERANGDESYSLLAEIAAGASPVAPPVLAVTCPSCGGALGPCTVICTSCGFNASTGEQMRVMTTMNALRGPRQRTTTVLGIVAIVLGSLGLLCLTAAVVAIFAAADQELISSASAYLSTIVGLMCKVGLIAVGVLMLLRHRLAMPVAVGTFALSMIGSAHDFVFVTLPQLDASPRPDNPAYTTGFQVGQIMGFAVVTLIVIAFYTTLIVHLRKPATRVEFGMG